ncbi:alpha/beta hydrolase [Nakamurella deserti]|uniref:alpha/beta hydrolase n=1 Tax=Nakamurella deserti TaxID=2164074 RepID=UPI000DBEAA84|nr:alpha/beta hydrolase [Nakamurella deserti]
MTLDAPVAEFLAFKPDAGASGTPVADRRRAILDASDEIFRRFGEPAPDVASVTDHVVDQPGGAIRVRVYRPHAAAPLPVHVFIHGGGFWLGSVDELVVDATCRERSTGADCVVVAVDYRLAPEHPFPTPVEDCYRALLWAHEHAASLGGDPSVLTIGGVSAGANLAAAVTLAVRDRGGPPLALQLLEVPALDLTLSSMVASGVGDDHGISVADMAVTVDLYLPAPADPTSPYASPLLATDLRGLPPAHILTAEFDPLRHEGERYAERLRDAGVPVVCRRQPGAVHGSLALTGRWEPARQWRAHLLDALRQAHHRAPGA